MIQEHFLPLFVEGEGPPQLIKNNVHLYPLQLQSPSRCQMGIPLMVEVERKMWLLFSSLANIDNLMTLLAYGGMDVNGDHKGYFYRNKSGQEKYVYPM